MSTSAYAMKLPFNQETQSFQDDDIFIVEDKIEDPQSSKYIVKIKAADFN